MSFEIDQRKKLLFQRVSIVGSEVSQWLPNQSAAANSCRARHAMAIFLKARRNEGENATVLGSGGTLFVLWSQHCTVDDDD